MKTKISYDDFLRFMGLIALQQEHDRATKNIERAAAGILGIEDVEGDFDLSHAYDALHCNRGLREALGYMKIEIEPQQATEQSAPGT